MFNFCAAQTWRTDIPRCRCTLNAKIWHCFSCCSLCVSQRRSSLLLLTYLIIFAVGIVIPPVVIPFLLIWKNIQTPQSFLKIERATYWVLITVKAISFIVSFIYVIEHADRKDNIGTSLKLLYFCTIFEITLLHKLGDLRGQRLEEQRSLL